ncbi:glycosyl hydrolase [Kallotenue papyrolyticum]|uniref:glycosyl hydrolase n=1 Tax=Kallotenue papyrolyticum TaxID=1325125 RepID=UPI00047859E3|nr:glycosyl hydrolase [Kallotenue papyrolyticum]
MTDAIDARAGAPAWPAATRTARPWTRWWWFGNAIDETEITRQLEALRAAGFGGVEISPIYAVEQSEIAPVPLLSPRWIALLRHALREAHRLDLGVDLLCGSGWPLGGPWVDPADAACRLIAHWFTPDHEGRLPEALRAPEAPYATRLALLACGPAGETLDLGERLDAHGRLQWCAPTADWRVLAVFVGGTGQQVKRAAPGGEGLVVDHFAAGAIRRYLQPFARLLAELPAELRPRCLFNDSYEVYGANWTPDLPAEFAQRRGYALGPYLPALLGQGDPELVQRVRCDYRHTLAELLLEHFVATWSAWAHSYGVGTRHQAHGAPGHLLDLYAAADIPETEAFGSDWLALAGREPLPPTPAHHGSRAEPLLLKLASSAAHLTGRPLCSSECCTWLGEHGSVPLAHIKAELDLLFLAGINHVFYHGTPASPAAAPWPGWMFYATTHVAPSNPFWRDLPALNAYISRCQALLQAGRPDNDLLLYFPIFDLWSAEIDAELAPLLTAHNTTAWLDQALAPWTATARALEQQGYAFDLVSDRLLREAVSVRDGHLTAGTSMYQALVLSGCRRIPPATLERMLALVRAGATLLIHGALPQDVPGLADLHRRQHRLQQALAPLAALSHAAAPVRELRLDAGRILVGESLTALLQAAAIRREPLVDAGLRAIRRRDADGWSYLIANLGQTPVDGWIPLAVPAQAVVIQEPLQGRHGLAPCRQHNAGSAVYLQLEPGSTLLLRAARAPLHDAAWPIFEAAGPPQPLVGAWRVRFVAGGPTLPAEREVQSLTSWTTWSDEQEALTAFAGTASYQMRLRLPADAEAWALDLGQVCWSARVRLDGRQVATLIAPPFRVLLPAGLSAGEHELEIEVTNLMANRLAAMDRRREAWRRFFFVSSTYQPFDASEWAPLPSGLLGPVRLVPLRRRHIG